MGTFSVPSSLGETGEGLKWWSVNCVGYYRLHRWLFLSPTDSTDFHRFFHPDHWIIYPRSLNGYHLAHGYHFIAHGSHRSFPPDHYFFWTRIARIKRDLSKTHWPKGSNLFHPDHWIIHPHGKSVSIRVPKNIRLFEQFVFKKNPCPSGICGRKNNHPCGRNTMWIFFFDFICHSVTIPM